MKRSATRMLAAVLALGTAAVAQGVSPESVELGRQLFQRQWSPRLPTLGNDGLGPLFNARSCVACHHQGGIGGGGDSRFNASALGIEKFWFTSSGPTIDNSRKTALLRQFYPGFVQADGTVRNTAPLAHFGGSPAYQSWRESFRSASGAMFSEAGGPTDASEVRVSVDSPIHFTAKLNHVTLNLQARIFQRNTTPLFGAGLVDAIPDGVIRRQATIQERHPEISGRAALLPDGTLGRFGWRANSSRLVRFVDRACGNELSLETERRPQPVDPSRPSYRNPSTDISDDEIRAMSDFLATLARPVQQLPTDPEAIARVNRGQAAFDSVGCAVCHVPTLGQVDGLYSDLLLHDMGPYLYDFDAAEPYVVSQKPLLQTKLVSRIEVPYYGNPTTVSSAAVLPNQFISPRSPQTLSDYKNVIASREIRTIGISSSNSNRASRPTALLRVREEVGVERRLKPTANTQEWRTPPLWGVRDSAPYMHDGRAESLLEAIVMHDGESAPTRDRFLQLPVQDRKALIEFLETLVAPPEAPQADL